MNKIIDCDIISNTISDHAFIEMQIQTSMSLKGKGFWKMNNSLLHNKEYLDKINKIIDLSQYRYDNLDLGTKWEMTKMDIIEYTQHFSHINASQRKQKYTRLKTKLQQLEKKLACININSHRSILIIEKTNTKIDEVKQN